VFRLFDFNINNPSLEEDVFNIQMFGKDSEGKTCSIFVQEYKPFFYVKVDDTWETTLKTSFLNHLKTKVGKNYEKAIVECKFVKRQKLYGFDGGKKYNFIMLKFANMNVFNKVKNLWYTNEVNREGVSERKLLKSGYYFKETYLELYEANIPPLLRFFHIQEVSPSGWIALPNSKTTEITHSNKTTTCDYEFMINYNNIIPLNDKELRVPYKIMSFDIEASSSHGDFPVPIKSYKKLATNVVDYFNKHNINPNPNDVKNTLTLIIKGAFGFTKVDSIDLVYPKEPITTLQELEKKINIWLNTLVRDYSNSNEHSIESIFENYHKENSGPDPEDDKGENNDSDDEDQDREKEIVSTPYKKILKETYKKVDTKTIVDILTDSKLDRENKLNELILSLRTCFPALEGDKVTFIGSTMLHYGEAEPYLNHCIVLNSCDEMPIPNSQIESYQTETEVLLAWKNLVQREDPDIIIGYNIFSFDYEFMFRRAQECDCVEDFLKLSRNQDEICATIDRETKDWAIEKSSITVATGTYDLSLIKMTGRLQIDMYNWFRKTEILSSYKLDYVGGYFIGDDVKEIELFEQDGEKFSKIKTANMTGLQEQSYIHFEEINHSSDYYKDGQKFKVYQVNRLEKWFSIYGHENPQAKKVKWGLAKDDVTPKDIFRMTNEGPAARSVIAKYCIQDCNLVHYLMNKVDVLTDLIEMSKLCSIPMSFLIFRGQGIKLTSYVAKKCRKKGVLMPVIEKGDKDEGYEGAIVLEPKCGLYLDRPIAVGDFASLYPSSMLSENLCPSSKVWTKIYNLKNELVLETGEKNEKDEYLYDHLPNYEYVDVTFDTFKYVRKNPKARAEKIKSGYKVCRFAQFKEGKAIMPSILEELLKARKDTRKLIPSQSDEFMKNVLDKRQLAYKVTANSLYGQLGAKTSTFYEPDIAASTTATGRLLLTYAKKVVEDCYQNIEVTTKSGEIVLTQAECVYGDSVANYTPVYVSTFRKSGEKDEEYRNIEILTIEQLAEKYGNNQWINCVEPGKQEKEFCELSNVETWTDKGWTRLFRVIRHKLASHKKMVRVLTHTGVVDVTDDHSLLLCDGKEISPKDVVVGTELLHHQLPESTSANIIFTEEESKIMGFFLGDGSCGEYFCKSGKKSSWALNNSCPSILNKYLELCKIAYPTFEWRIMDTIESSGVYKIAPKCRTHGSIVNFVSYYRNLMYSNKSKIIPHEIINSNEKIRQAFLEGLYDADGDKDIRGYVRIDQKNQITASHIAWLANSLGWKTSINTRSDKLHIYRITMTKNSQRKNQNAIKKLYEIPYQGYVYDLTTDNHHFAAGVGNMIVHNTDSVFFTFNLKDNTTMQPIVGKKALEFSIEIAKDSCHLVSSFLKAPHDFEYEKTFMPFCLLSKKRYVGILYEHDPNKGKRKEMGIVLKRRDNAPIVKDIYGGVIDILMKEQDLKKALSYVEKCLQELVEGKVPVEKLIITKSLRSFYKKPQQIAHKVLADRIAARDPGNKPSSGDRIPFVYVVHKNKKALQGEKIETPTFIKETGLQIDYSFYISNQIMKPLLQLFGLVLEDIWKMQNKTSKISKFKREIETLKNTEEKWEDKITKLKDKEVKILIFDKFLRETNNNKERNQSLVNFFGKK